MSAQIPNSDLPRILIIGAGFGGLKLARKLSNKAFQIVLIDRNNYHQFQPLFYQVATAGLAPSAISFPIRKLFHKAKNVHFRVAEALKVDTKAKTLSTDIGDIRYDKLVIATGADTNYYGNEEIKQHSFPMKSTSESLQLRNRILECMELALTEKIEADRSAFMNVAIVGAGPTGVELAGAISEMRTYILPKDYPELDFSEMNIYLLEAGDRILGTMSESASKASHSFLKKMGVQIITNARVTGYKGTSIEMSDLESINTKTLIWSAGVAGNVVAGFDPENILRSRMRIDSHCQVIDQADIYAIGDIAAIEGADHPHGHPQVAQVAMQQADLLAKNFIMTSQGKRAKKFTYQDLGSMATIGRSKAVADLPFLKFSGFFAWIFWLFVHLMNILGVKNKLFIFIEWLWYYLSFDQSLRLVIKQKKVPTRRLGL